MGLIREPEGVDFVIQSKPLTEEEEQALNKFICEYKEKHKSRAVLKKPIQKRKQLVEK